MGYTPTSSSSGPLVYEFDEADSSANIVMESDGDPPKGSAGLGSVSVSGGGVLNSPSGGNMGSISSSSSSGSGTSRNIKCATLNKLVERVTHEKYVDLNTRYVFLLTYHSFTTPRELLAKLRSRFHVPLPPNLSPEELRHFKTSKLDRIQIRVGSVLKNWIDEHWNDFSGEDEESLELKKDLHQLIQNMLDNSGSLLTTQLAKALLALVKKKEKASLLNGSGGASSRLTATSPMPSSSHHGKSSSSPPSIFTSKHAIDSSDFLLQLDDVELARQLTLLDFSKFKSIQPRECLNQNWSKKAEIKQRLAPNILGMISQFNSVSNWVERMILKEKEVKVRVKLYEKFIKIADQCRALNNFNSLFAIYCGLTANPIHRLKKTQVGVGTKYQKKFQEYVELFRGDKNSRNFRRVLQMSLTPCIPHLGIFLSDLTFTEDGNPDLLDGKINFQKRCKLAERIRWIKQYQQEGYNGFPSLPEYGTYFSKVWVEIDPETLWKMSLEVEPREPKQ